LWSKLDEQKKLTKEERDRRWDEISRALSIEKELERAKAEFDEVNEKRDEAWRRLLSATVDERNDLKARLPVLQDKLSALLCPMNDHVWVDGICTKCGRMHENRSD
jgi:seryl-tRNA synthetase